MSQLRNPSARPSLVVDERSKSVADPTSPTPQRVGMAGPFGRERVVVALSTGMVELKRATVVADTDLVSVLGQDVLGPSDRIVVHRMVWAGKAEDTRRL